MDGCVWVCIIFYHHLALSFLFRVWCGVSVCVYDMFWWHNTICCLEMATHLHCYEQSTSENAIFSQFLLILILFIENFRESLKDQWINFVSKHKKIQMILCRILFNWHIHYLETRLYYWHGYCETLLSQKTILQWKQNTTTFQLHSFYSSRLCLYRIYTNEKSTIW